MIPQTSGSDSGRNYWDRHAASYGMSMRLLGRPIARMCELIAEELAGADDVLEVAAGTGLATVPAAKAARRVIATDYSGEMLHILREKVRRAGFANVECIQRDIYSLGFAPCSFDAVLCANVLHLVPDLPAALAALRAVLRPNGKLLAPTFCHLETWFSLGLSRLLAITGFPGYRRFRSASLRYELEQAGLRVEKQETISGPIPICFVFGAFTT